MLKKTGRSADPNLLDPQIDRVASTMAVFSRRTSTVAAGRRVESEPFQIPIQTGHDPVPSGNRPAAVRASLDASFCPTPCLFILHGPPKSGQTLMAHWMIERARAGGREILVGDGNWRSPSLANLYPPRTAGGATQPAGISMAETIDWLADELGRMTLHRASLLIEFEDGHRFFSMFRHDLDFSEFCLEAGLPVVSIYVCGPDLEDFDHILAIHRAGYIRAQRTALVLNQHLVGPGTSGKRAFDPLMNSPHGAELEKDGVRFLAMPSLRCFAEMRAAGLGLNAAIGSELGRDGASLDAVRRAQVKHWSRTMEEQCTNAGILGWLP